MKDSADDRRLCVVDEELEQILDEATETIKQVREELLLRRLAQQHAEIDRLDEHLATAKVRWAEVRTFFADVLTELRGGEDGTSGNEDGGGADARG